MPTVAGDIDLVGIAKSCGYMNAVSVNNYDDLDRELHEGMDCGELCFIEVKCAIGARADLGRPTTTPADNKLAFMKHLYS